MSAHIQCTEEKKRASYPSNSYKRLSVTLRLSIRISPPLLTWVINASAHTSDSLYVKRPVMAIVRREFLNKSIPPLFGGVALNRNEIGAIVTCNFPQLSLSAGLCCQDVSAPATHQARLPVTDPGTCHRRSSHPSSAEHFEQFHIDCRRFDLACQYFLGLVLYNSEYSVPQQFCLWHTPKEKGP